MMFLSHMKARFFAVSSIGIVLLIVYQFVFMTRTSVVRDWNHLHSVKLGLRAAQQSLLLDTETTTDFAFHKVPFKSELPNSFINQASTLGSPMGFHVSRYTKLFRYQLNDHNLKLRIRAQDVGILQLSELTDLKSQIEFSSKLFKALVVVVPNDYVPLFKADVYKVPILVTNKWPKLNKILFLNFADVENVNYVSEFKGVLAEQVVVGCQLNCQNFMELHKTIQRVGNEFVWIRSLKFIKHEVGVLPKLKNTLVYLDMEGQLPSSTPMTMSLLKRYLLEFQEGLDLSTIGEPQLVHAPSGVLDLYFQQGIQVLSPFLGTHSAMLGGMIALELTQNALLPFDLDVYNTLLNSQLNTECLFDLLNDVNTEFAWYQFFTKMWLLGKLRVTNYKLHQMELQLVENDGHMLFKYNNEYTATQFKGYNSERARQRLQSYKLC